MSNMTPREIVHELDRHIVGQRAAKRAVAVALRNRWRRMQLEPGMAAEVTPKNILMIGPTGVGKTEIARRLARLANAPFLKVEATKFTDVGYVGRDVESIVRDLVEASIKMHREAELASVRERAADAAEERVLAALVEDGDPVLTRLVDRARRRDGLLPTRAAIRSGSRGPAAGRRPDPPPGRTPSARRHSRPWRPAPPPRAVRQGPHFPPPFRP